MGIKRMHFFLLDENLFQRWILLTGPRILLLCLHLFIFICSFLIDYHWRLIVSLVLFISFVYFHLSFGYLESFFPLFFFFFFFFILLQYDRCSLSNWSIWFWRRRINIDNLLQNIPSVSSRCLIKDWHFWKTPSIISVFVVSEQAKFFFQAKIF